VLSAAALARLVELAPGPGSVPAWPRRLWTGWDHAGPGAVAAPEDRRRHLNAYPETAGLARVAAAVRDHLRGHGGDLVTGHGGLAPRGTCAARPAADRRARRDSVICQPEPAIGRARCRQLLRNRRPGQDASVKDSAAFLDAYQPPGRRWPSGATRPAGTRRLCSSAVRCKIQSLDVDPGQIRPGMKPEPACAWPG